MKTLLSLFMIFLAVAMPAKKSGKENPDKLKLEFQKRADAWKDAYNSNDPKALASFYTQDAKYVSGHVAGLVADGKEKIIAYLGNGIKGGGHIDSVEILDMDLSGNMAYLFCRYKANNSGQKVEGRNIIILKKTDKEWKFVLHATVV